MGAGAGHVIVGLIRPFAVTVSKVVPYLLSLSAALMVVVPAAFPVASP
jgi:hypothetical protein